VGGHLVLLQTLPYTVESLLEVDVGAGTSRGAGVGGGTCKDPHVDEEIGRLAGVGKAGADQVRLGRSLGEDDVVAGVAVEDVEDSCR